MSAEVPVTPAIELFYKPSAKLASPVARNLFGRSEASTVTQMLNEIIVADRNRARLNLDFDIQSEKPIKVEQQENVAEIGRNRELRRRFHWKSIRDCDAPEFYSRKYKGKKCLMPVDLLECSEDEASPSKASGRSRTARRSLNGYLRSPSKNLSPKPIVRPASASKLHFSPLRLASDSPVAFDDTTTHSKAPLSVLRPLPLLASVENQSTVAKFTSPVKPAVTPLRTTRSPLNPRENDSRSVRAITFCDIEGKSPSLFKKTTTKISFTDARPNAESCPETPRPLETSLTPSQTTPCTPASSSSRSLRDTKITDHMQIRKSRSSAQKARKRLIMHQEESNTTVPSTKTPRIV